MTQPQGLFRWVLACSVITIAVGAHLLAAGPGEDLRAQGQWADSWQDEAPEQRSGNYREEVSDRQTHTLALGPNGSLELRTISGDVTVTAGPGADVSLEIVRTSRGQTAADARQGLADVRATVDHKGERASVDVVTPGRKQAPYSVDVSYVVTAPAGTRITASSISGNVTLRNIKGDISTTSTSGDLHITGAAQVSAAKSVSGDITVLNLSSRAGITVSCGSGDVLLDQITAPRVDIEAISGNVVVTNATSAGASLRATSGNIEYSGAIAAGGRYEFLAHSGDVRVVATGSTGFELQATTFSGSLRTEPATLLRAVSASTVALGGGRGDRSPRSLRGTAGDGSAVVVMTTFSGDATIVRR